MLTKKTNATPDQQKGIRDKLRQLGFYISDFTQSYDGFTLDDFETLVQQKQIIFAETDPETKAQLAFVHPGRTATGSKTRDEDYIIDLCDMVLGVNALRQHRFGFLRGDAGTCLPVDAYYRTLNLVIEYRERQHTEPIAFFDKPERLTVSGVPRGEQRRIYDQRRRDILAQHGIDLIELSYERFSHGGNKRLHRLWQLK